MTLTTHGTEYFRDPELVRMALRGVKVHQIDGARFDVYAAGAVLYAVIENQFPAHGGLSRIERRCPEALRWIIRRAMTDYDKRYLTSRAMLADLEVVLHADDPFALKPAELPSMRGDGADAAAEAVAAAVPLDPIEMPEPERQNPLRDPAQPVGTPAAEPPVPPRAAPNARRVRLANWWTGAMAAADDDPRPARPAHAATSRRRVAGPRVAPGDRAPASEQLKAARERAAQRRNSARERIGRHGRHATAKKKTTGGLGTALLVVVVFVGLGVGVGLAAYSQRSASVAAGQAEASAAIASDEAAFENRFAQILGDAEAAASAGMNDAQAEVREQLAEAERQLSSALSDASDTAKSGLESALRGIRDARHALGLRAPAGMNDHSAAVPPAVPHPPVTPGITMPARAFEIGGPLATPGARVAFLSDFRPPLERELSSQTAGVVGLLRGAGADVFGEVVSPSKDPAKAGREIGSIAEIRHARGRSPIDANTTAETMRRFVERDDKIDAVLWIAPDPDDEDAVRLLIATPRFASFVVAEDLHPGLLARYTLPSTN